MEVYTLKNEISFLGQNIIGHMLEVGLIFIFEHSARHRFIKKIYVNTLMIIMENCSPEHLVEFGVTPLICVKVPAVLVNVNSVKNTVNSWYYFWKQFWCYGFPDMISKIPGLLRTCFKYESFRPSLSKEKRECTFFYFNCSFCLI